MSTNKKPTVVELIIQKLLDEIASGTYKAGSKFPNEFQLMETLGVSRNSLREAIKSLSIMGIVEIKRGDGTYVCSQLMPSIFDSAIYNMISGESSSAEMLELRQIIDETIVRLSMEKITEEELESLFENTKEMTKSIANGDMKLAQELDLDFHKKLIDSCKNSFFIRIAKGIYTIFERSIGENVSLERVNSLAPYFHKKILICIREKDTANISKTVKNSLITWHERLQ
ncbi:MAG: FadR/GntR family transcriptional regulator [Clostridia bacterium]